MQVVWYTRLMQLAIPISEARAGLSDLAASVFFARRCIVLTQRGKPRVALVPPELADAIIAAGGADAALKMLRDGMALPQTGQEPPEAPRERPALGHAGHPPAESGYAPGGELALEMRVPCTVEQDEDGVWCASAFIRPGVGAAGDGTTPEEAIAGLRTALEALLDVAG